MQPNDIAFAAHALLLSLVIFGQSFFYKVRPNVPFFPLFLAFMTLSFGLRQRDPHQHLSPYNRLVLFSSILVILIGTFLAASSNVLQALDLILILSAIKLYISFAKYVPQAWINYKRKSTEGWTIGNILLDFSGGVLSLYVGFSFLAWRTTLTEHFDPQHTARTGLLDR